MGQMLCCVERGGFFGSDSHSARIAEAQANANREKARINKEIEKGSIYPCSVAIDCADIASNYCTIWLTNEMLHTLLLLPMQLTNLSKQLGMLVADRNIHPQPSKSCNRQVPNR